MNLPALEGGTPVRKTMLPYGHQSIDESDIRAVVDGLQSDWLTTGPKVEEFEKAFAKATGAKYSVAMNSGTAALHATMFSAGIGPGDEVIVPALTFAATANCVRYVGGTVVFADVRPDILCVDVEQVHKLITDKTRAIITVDYAGHPSPLSELQEEAEGRGLRLIEDAAHSLGGRYYNQNVGSIAGVDMTTFSFHPVKGITTGEGGMVTMNDSILASKLRHFRTHGISTDQQLRADYGDWFYEMNDLGYNYRLTDIQCALGLSQLKKLPDFLNARRRIAERYNEQLRDIRGLILPARLEGNDSGWHLYVVRLALENFHCTRNVIFRALRAEGIGVQVHYIPVPWHPYYQALGYKRGSWPVAEDAYERMLSLPIWPGMTERDQEDVIVAVKKVIEYYRK